METHARDGQSGRRRRGTSAQATEWRGRRGFTCASVESTGAPALKLRHYALFFLLVFSLAGFTRAQDPAAAPSVTAPQPETSTPAQTPTVSVTTQSSSFEIS